MFCPQCGKKVPKKAQFCSSCGTKIEAPAPSQSAATPSSPQVKTAPPASPQPTLAPVAPAPAAKPKKKNHCCLIAVIVFLVVFVLPSIALFIFWLVVGLANR